MASGYLVGNPVSYHAPDDKEALESILKEMREASIDSVDAELATQASIMGRGVEILYANTDASPRAVVASPLDTFVAYDDTVEHKPLFAVRRFTRAGREHFADVYTADSIYHFSGGKDGLDHLLSTEAHFFGDVPVIEYWNNADERGDFENVMGLIDAYNAVESDRVNDKQQFTDAILVTRGVSEIAAGEDEDDLRTPAQRLNDEKLLMFPDKEADASFLTKQLSQQDTEVLKDALKADIHKFSLVPDMTDTQFAGNSSGVAMRFKLLGLEQLTKMKERWFREGLRTRLKLFAHFMQVKGVKVSDVNRVQIVFTRALPVNDLEIAQTIQALRGLVPEDVLLSQVPFMHSGV